MEVSGGFIHWPSHDWTGNTCDRCSTRRTWEDGRWVYYDPETGITSKGEPGLCMTDAPMGGSDG